MKKILKMLLCMLCMFNMLIITNVFAESDSNVNDDRLNEVVINLMVDKDNIQIISEDYGMPIEVQKRIEAIYNENPNAIVTVSNVDVQKKRTRGSYWAPVRTYGKYQLQDWFISNTGSSGAKNVKTGVNTSEVLDKIGFAVGGILLDVIYPFGTAISVLQAFNVGNTYTTNSDDKLDVSIKTTSIEKFTYVIIAGRKMLGTKSYYSTLNEAAWTFYSKTIQRHFQKISTYNKNYATSSYMFPDQKAVTSFGNGGYIDQPPSIKIGIATFSLY